ncbi:Protein of unknown function [Gryllus bimaculatus]|nr:Protein of unknown function [Gryllus bimaculatus]
MFLLERRRPLAQHVESRSNAFARFAVELGGRRAHALSPPDIRHRPELRLHTACVAWTRWVRHVFPPLACASGAVAQPPESKTTFLRRLHSFRARAGQVLHPATPRPTTPLSSTVLTVAEGVGGGGRTLDGAAAFRGGGRGRDVTRAPRRAGARRQRAVSEARRVGADASNFASPDILDAPPRARALGVGVTQSGTRSLIYHTRVCAGQSGRDSRLRVSSARPSRGFTGISQRVCLCRLGSPPGFRVFGDIITCELTTRQLGRVPREELPNIFAE